MIAGTSSGSGKTLVTCGILQALVNRGMKVSSFKCGPDYIDPMFHSKVIGTRSRNLDSFFVDDDVLRYLFCRSAEGSDVSVIEGVMGFYDGKTAADSSGSSCDISLKLDTPVVLTVDCRGSSLSCIPIIKGFMEYQENNIAGVILNNMGGSIFPSIRDRIESELDVKVIGHVPKLKDIGLESRHLGLVMPSEIDDLKDQLNRLADILEGTLDLDMLMATASSASDLEYEVPEHRRLDGRVRIGIASDEAFCFNYEDNLELLEECGAELVEFSPMHDRELPEGISGIVLYGGYPELHAEELSGNTGMLESIRNSISDGMPCLAECGGFMYLHRRMEDPDGRFWNMADVIHYDTFNRHRLSRFGYVTMTPRGEGSVLPGTGIKGHEFHHWDSEDPGNDWNAVRSNGDAYACMHESGNLTAGYPHLYYYSNPDFPYGFLKRCEGYGR